ncbi:MULTISPECIES: hypothetical protein [unclassified Paenibacillus]|uniref:hypothetical protein n=1 Tax=unclassified Paenibacillus TaxID=185978 RepID=UPI0024074C06|nr:MULTISPECIES: hypothetical protein [unclassified Paenibacillus]MDF9841608.1 type II secretory pathway component PulM [Paenibacillus sp. PastF-2]MDF9848280.1 type II secretory pathway component PulM [Paenibacillus sp. PastM-2]MDF9854767.1 type II secretory pathway component PulM [Paenibacillus sp. PastF-1]MDH6480037.1 type II secretory pathway component PulM [Paenibacillus sp. PastH-2]MDH6507470.1 type II secretory pathway component PulM [Paenibacillus sp. PastM-3]
MRVAGSSSGPFAPRKVPPRARASGIQRRYRRRDARESEIVLILVLFMLLIVVLLFFS